MKIVLTDNRRLTGPNLFWDWPAAILDISLQDIPADLVIAAWAEEVTRLMDAMGWDSARICSREYAGGASLVINAPIDVLYTACELNEVAWASAMSASTGTEAPDPGEEVPRLTRLFDEERNPSLLALQAAGNDE